MPSNKKVEPKRTTISLKWGIITLSVFLISGLTPIVWYVIYYFKMGHTELELSPNALLFLVLPLIGFALLVWKSKEAN